jgi:hypothetical protein
MTILRAGARGLAAGLAGTAVMTATMHLEAAVRKNRTLPVDYDATGHVVTAMATVLHHQPGDDRQRAAMYELGHWGYGTGLAASYPLLRTVRPGRGAVALFVLSQTVAFTMFPAIGGTPPPWRWRKDVLASSLVQHAIYAASVAAADRALRAESR